MKGLKIINLNGKIKLKFFFSRLCLRRRTHIMQRQLQLLQQQRASQGSVALVVLEVLVNSDIGTPHNLIQRQQRRCKLADSFKECRVTHMANFRVISKPNIQGKFYEKKNLKFLLNKYSHKKAVLFTFIIVVPAKIVKPTHF